MRGTTGQQLPRQDVVEEGDHATDSTDKLRKAQADRARTNTAGRTSLLLRAKLEAASGTIARKVLGQIVHQETAHQEVR